MPNSTHYRVKDNLPGHGKTQYFSTNNSADIDKIKQMYSQEQHKNPNNQTSELLTDTENEYNELKPRSECTPPA